MSEKKHNIDEEMRTSYLEMSTNIKCNIHQVLNKYYLKSKGIFVCEYDGFDEDGPESFMHMPQILEEYHDEIIKLQNHPEYFQHNELSLKVPNYAKKGKQLNIEISKFNYEYEKFMEDTFTKIIHFIKANYSLIEIKDLINEVKFTRDRKPDLKKIGMDDQKEQNLLILAQFLVLHNYDSISKVELTENYIKFLEDYQYKMVEMIFNSLDFLDLSYQFFLPEIAKLEKKNIEEIKNKDYLKSHITSPKNTEVLIQKYLNIIKERDLEIMQLKENVKIEKNQKIYLEDANRDLQKKINELQKSSKQKDELNRNRIEELENIIFNLTHENDKNNNQKLKNYSEDLKKMRDFHDLEINKIKSDYQTQNENQKKEFDILLNSFKNQHSELEKNQKNISSSVYDSNNLDQGKRMKELEALLNEERKKNQLLQVESDKKLKEINKLYFEISKDQENDKKRNLEYETKIIELTNKLNLLEKENENLRKILQEKENVILKSLDEHNNQRKEDKVNIDSLLLNLKEKEGHNEKFKKELEANENYKKYFDMYINTKKEHEKVLFENDGLVTSNKYLQKELELAKADQGNALNSLKTKGDEFNLNFHNINNLNINLKKELNEKNRKLELIQKQTDILNDKIKPYPWGINKSLISETKSISEVKKINPENEGILKELDYKCNSLKKQNEIKDTTILNLVSENEQMKNRIIYLYGLFGKNQAPPETKEMKILQNEKVKILMEKINKKEKTEKDFKNLNFIDNDLNSLLLVNRVNYPQIRNWMYPLMKNFLEIKDLKSSFNLNLLHKASIHGFSAQSFNKNCSNMSNLLVICLTEHGKLIGGFSPLKWIIPNNEQKVYIKDEEMKSFLFSLDLNRKLPLFNKNFAICCSNNLGPVFGGGSDLEIVNEANKNYNKFGNIGNSYSDGKAISPKEFYGAEKYLVQDYEVYQVLL